MPNDGITREYNWQDILCLVMLDMGLDPKDRQHHELWYCGGFSPPEHDKDKCIVITKYEVDFKARLDEMTRDKL